MSWQKILRDKIKSPQPNKTNSNFTQFQKSKNLGLKAHLPSTQSEAREAQTKTRDKSDQEDIYIDITNSSSIEMSTTIFLVAKKGKKENPESPKTTTHRANPKSTPKNQPQPKPKPKKNANPTQRPILPKTPVTRNSLLLQRSGRRGTGWTRWRRLG